MLLSQYEGLKEVKVKTALVDMKEAAARLKDWKISAEEMGVLLTKDGVAAVLTERPDEYVGRCLKEPMKHNLPFRKNQTRKMYEFEVRLLARNRPDEFLQKTV